MGVDGWRNALNMVKIYADEREKASGIPEILSSLGVTVIYKVLDVGDYVINSSLVIERKRVDDLVKSVFDGRFFEQVERLSEICDTPMLIIEGGLSSIKHLTTRWKSVEGALITAILRFRVIPYYTEDSRHTAEVIKHVAEKLSAEKPFKSYSRRAIKPRGDDIREWQLYVLQSLPGIGVKTARKLLEKFGNLRAVFNASQSELSVIDGISEEKASKIIKVITEPYAVRAKSSSGLSKYIENPPKDSS
ncbi:MAG: ERCC4 domain-containing protein [Sulfolobales archaeon]